MLHLSRGKYLKARGHLSLVLKFRKEYLGRVEVRKLQRIHPYASAEKSVLMDRLQYPLFTELPDD